MGIERRKYIRFDSTISGEFHVLGSDVSGMLVTDNFSKDGFKASSNQNIPIGSRLECEMVFPETIMPFFTTGRVVWVKDTPQSAAAKFDIGVQLEEMDTVERQFLIDYCYKTWNNSKRHNPSSDISAV
ncbi:MAG: PilZ domain-containing protein [Candidatus Omnitrophica bacterium]|nr:PilZ domain-containing protein [Candidatus Omnitrophota bacterium]MBU4479433.1 PilZ domain-containing protein [Candidatus Omnitrophota bacterium]MCG2703176.1 PilZ domain-containing protein [Candidatus Omnitrophota bacterium]